MATNLQFVPGRKKGHDNPVLCGFRFTLDKTRNDTKYYKCCLHKAGCRARITIVDRQLSSPIPEHNHDIVFVYFILCYILYIFNL